MWLVANGVVAPERILGLTFTRKAAGELGRKIRSRLARLNHSVPELKLSHGEPTVSTYNAYAGNLVAEHGMRVGLESGTRVVTDAARWQLAYDLVANWGGDLSAFDVSVARVTDLVLQLSAEMSEHLVTPDRVRDFDNDFAEEVLARCDAKPSNQESRDMVSLGDRRRQLLALVEAWDEVKREHGVIDFSDQLKFANTVVAEHPAIVSEERNRWGVVLLDEYQDTSVSQTELLHGLFGGGHPVTAVGDPIQAIYSWRGASTGALARFPSLFSDPAGDDAEIMHLTRSWRNRRNVLTVANAISRPLREGHSRGSEPGMVIPPLQAGVEGPAQVDAAMHTTADEEAAWVARHLTHSWGPNRDKSAAVLVRSRKLIPALRSALEAAGLPVRVVGSVGLLHYPEVLEVVSMLRVLADPADGPALMRQLTGPRWRIGPRDIKALWERARELVPQAHGFEPEVTHFNEESELEALLSDAVADPGEGDRYSPVLLERLAAFQAETDWLRGRLQQSLPDLVSEVVSVTGLEVETLLHQGGVDNLDEFVSLAAEYEFHNDAASLPGFLSYLEALNQKERGAVIESAETELGAIQLLTVHAAKGLEWDIVAVPGLSNKVFPSAPKTTKWPVKPEHVPYPLRGDRDYLPTFHFADTTTSSELKTGLSEFSRDDSDDKLDEERRLAYVAFTRARETLLVSGYYFERGTKGARPPSDYLNDAIEAGAVKTRWDAKPDTNPYENQSWSATWPTPDPLGERQKVVAEAALRVATATDAVDDDPDGQEAQWIRDTELLLRERAERDSARIPVEYPSRLSTSQLVALWGDADSFARARRRPMPSVQQEATARGTDFHAWVEEFFGQRPLFDPVDMPGASDADLVVSDVELRELKERFERSEWAQRSLVAQEVPFVVSVDGTPVRGRIDAVFARDDGDWDVVDWKTGKPPHGERAERAAVQLAVYRHAWARLNSVDPSRVHVAFYYVGANQTVRPESLPELRFG